MIIRKQNIQNRKSQQSSSDKIVKRGNIIKKEDLLLDVENVLGDTKETEPNAPIQKPKVSEETVSETFEKIDISSIEFKERVERRRGDRRRGYRRIDERSLVSRAQQEAHSIKELAAREGYQNGLQKAQDEVEEIKTSLSEFLALKNEMYEEFYPHIMEIAVEIAKKIIKKEVELSQDVLKNIIMSVLDEIHSDCEKVMIKVNPSDVEFASASLPEILSAKNVSAKVNIVPDETIEKGSCAVVANNGVIDANFKTQLAVLQSAFGIYKGGV